MENEKITNVLIVEDELYVRNSIKRSIPKCYTIIEASNGAEALNIIDKDNLPSLIISDIMMPGMDGFEFLKELRRRKHDIPVLVLTAKVLTREDTKFLNENGIRFLALKGDVDPGDLVRKIRTMTSQGAPLADKESLGEGTEK